MTWIKWLIVCVKAKYFSEIVILILEFCFRNIFLSCCFYFSFTFVYFRCFWILLSYFLGYDQIKNKLGLSWAKLSPSWGLKWEFEVEVWTYSLKLQIVIVDWSLSLTLTFEFEGEILSWSLKLMFEVEVSTLSLKLKFEVEVWG